ncbi:MAG: hypothetical protein IJX14_11675 [Clostridia bacterium]|nr:hypothetical protein [Clostridia bacterium]
MKRFLTFLLLMLLCTSCSSGTDLPADFSFSLRWEYDGMCSYDSTTGDLVRGAGQTEYILTESEKQDIHALLQELDIQTYPDVYDPNPNLATCPPMTLVLTVRTEGWEKTVTAEEIAFDYTSDDRQGQQFLDVCAGIRDILENTAAWQTLPEPDLFFLE